MKRTVIIFISLFILGLLVIGGNFTSITGGAKGSVIKPQCSDGRDNDKDGYCDYITANTRCPSGVQKGDPDCSSTSDNKEAPDCVPSTEICDNKDNDCDGIVDEGLINQCGITDIGECQYGTQTCSAGVWSSCTGNIDPSTEICDNKDNDCDGIVDEGCLKGELTLSTLKDNYFLNEMVKLTDPPAENKNAKPTTVSNNANRLEIINGPQDYIIELKDKSILELKNELDNKVARNVLPRSHADKQLEDYKKQIISIQDTAEKDLKKRISSMVVIKRKYKTVLNGFAVEQLSSEDVEELRKSQYVSRIIPDVEVRATLAESVPLIKGDNVWNLGYTGNGMEIGIIDTGVDYTHSDLGGCFGTNCKVAGGYDFMNNDADPMDDHGHGTHVAATAAGNGVLKGVAYEATVYAYKVLSNYGSGSSSNIIAAIERSADPNQDGDYSDRLDVISLSLGGSGNPDDPMSKALDNVASLGVIPVVAAGNSGPSPQTITSPGTSRKAITVAASDKNDQIASFSSRGPVEWNGETIEKPDITAPGVSICAAQWDSYSSSSQCSPPREKHIAISGTSMATPHIAGVAALIKQVHPDWDVQTIKNAIKTGAVNIGYDVYTQGAGRVDALTSVSLGTNFPYVDIKPIFGQIGYDNKNRYINVVGSATGNNFQNYVLYIGNGESPAASWDTLTTSTIPITESTIYTLDTSLYSEGTYTLKLEMTLTTGEKYFDTTKMIVNRDYLIYPVNGKNAVLRMKINGSSGGPGFQRYTLEWGLGEIPIEWSTTGIVLTNGGTSPVDGILATFDASSLTRETTYTLRLRTYFDGGIDEEKVKFHLSRYDVLQGWPIDTYWTPSGHLAFEVAPRSTDFNNDNRKEIILYERTSSPVLRVLKDDGTDFIPGIRTSMYKPVPAIADINKDNYPEIIVGFNGMKFEVFDKNGAFMAGWKDRTFTGISIVQYSPPSIADLDNDGGDLEIIEGTAEGSVYIFNADSTDFMPGTWPKSGFGGITSSISIADVDKDGDSELFFVTDAGKLYAYHHNGNPVSGNWPVTIVKGTGPTLFYRQLVPPVLGDINCDGEIEIVSYASTKDKISIYDKSGNIISQISGGILTIDSVPLMSKITLADVDAECGNEIIFTTENTAAGKLYLYIYNYQGQMLLSKYLPTDSNEMYAHFYATPRGSAVVGEKGSDKILFVPTSFYSRESNGRIAVFKVSGGTISEMPSIIEYSPKAVGTTSLMMGFHTTPILLDIDADGNLELFALANDGRVFAWELPQDVLPQKIIWGTDGYDPRNTNYYKTIPRPKSQIKNTGIKDITGYLLMKVQRYASDNWQDVKIVVDEATTPRTIPAGQNLALDTIWDASGAYTTTEVGRFRVYTAFKDASGQVIKTEIGPLENVYEFSVS